MVLDSAEGVVEGLGYVAGSAGGVVEGGVELAVVEGLDSGGQAFDETWEPVGQLGHVAQHGAHGDHVDVGLDTAEGARGL